MALLLTVILKAFVHCQKKNIISGALGNTLLIQTPGKHTRRSKRTDKMATWILEIIQLNKTIQANSNITTCLSLSPLPSSFLDLVKQKIGTNSTGTAFSLVSPLGIKLFFIPNSCPGARGF